MTDRPYTDDDLLAEAARQHRALPWGPWFDAVRREMAGQPIREGATTWDDLPEAEFDAAHKRVFQMLLGAAHLSAWAVRLGADGLEPDEHTLQLAVGPSDGESESRVRVHFAFHPDMAAPARDQFVMNLAKGIAAVL
ncbi:hypothetical protein [Wenjunlia vitaminophila]|uniref:hypothetical protein n=1 Tax=Wenjunlia vitaminophila TaxID=76728 RepID=UPI000374B044|nr:hypothetical protein [Wenjunlia vitaminophila]